MKRRTYAIGLLCVVALAILVLARIDEDSLSGQTSQSACTYYGGACISPAILSGMSIRLFP